MSAWLFALALFGYPLAGALASVLQVESRAVSIPFRMLVLLVGLVVLASSRLPRGGGLRTLLMLVWFAYSLRLFHDTFISPVDGADYALMFFLAGTLLPAVALLAREEWEQKTFARVSLGLATLGCAAMLLGNRFGTFGDSDLTEAAGRLTVIALSPIGLGHLAASAVLCCIALWRTSGWALRTALIAAAGLASAALMAAGSKGPALALCVALMAWSFRHITKRWPIPILAFMAATALVTISDNPLMTRLIAASEDLSTFERMVLWQNSIAQIAGAPIVGSAYVELESGFYPHNVVLESALALGLPLASVFVVLLLCGSWRAWRALASPSEDLLGLLYFQALVGAMFSGSMYGATMLWVTLALLFRRRPTPRRSGAERHLSSGRPSDIPASLA